MSRRQLLSVEHLEPRDVPSRYIVTLQPGVNAEQFAAEQQGRGRDVALVFSHALNGVVIEGARPGFDPRVVAVEPDRMVSIEGKSTSPPPPQPAQVVPTGIARVGGPGGAGLNLGAVNVAVIDTGLDRGITTRSGIVGSHPDLNIAGGVNFSSRSTSWADDNGHGTHVSGTIGAVDNSIGVVGVAPGVSLYGVKVLDRNGNGWVSNIIAGIDWVTATRGDDGNAANDIAVANMSLGFFGDSAAMRAAIHNSVAAGVVYVVSAGNSTADAGNYSPARFGEVITVSALADSDGKSGGSGAATSYGPDDTLATFSNYGAAVDLAAPGVDILSTLPGGGYGKGTGTSMASPHVAGAAALYVALHGATNSGGKIALTDASAVAAARDALVAAAQPMDDWRADNKDVESDGRDSFHEGTLYINRDAAVLAIAPGSGFVGVTVANESSVAQQRIVVYLYADAELVGPTEVTNLAAGASTTVSFPGTFTGQLRAEVSTEFDVDPVDNVLLLP